MPVLSFIEPCLPSLADRLPSGPDWVQCTAATTKALLTYPRPTSTSDAAKPSCWKEKDPRYCSEGCCQTTVPSYVSHGLAKWMKRHDMAHVRGAPYHPMTQGKIERWHQTLKNRILLENYYLPGDLENQIEAFVADYNHRRYHESIANLTPADVYFGPGQTILLERERIKRKTIKTRRLIHRRHAA
jgi:putative transposase